MTSTGDVHVGIIAAANIAKKLVRAALSYQTGIAFTAVGSRTLEKAKAFITDSGLEGKATAYGSYLEVIQDPNVDAVYIPLPSNLHYEWVVKAAEHGKSILCEKPISMTLEDCENIVSICRKERVLFMDGTMWLHNPRTQLLSKVLHEEKLIGNVNHTVNTFSFILDDMMHNVRVKKDLDGLGVLGDIGWYCTSMALFVKQYTAPVQAAAHPGGTFTAEGVPVILGATITWADGSTATFYVSFKGWLTQDTKVIGDKGNVTILDTFIPEDESKCGFLLREMRNGAHGYGNLSDMRVHPDMPQEAHMLSTFAKCVATSKAQGAPEHSWLRRSWLTQRVLCAIMASAQNGCAPVPIEQLEEW